MGAYEGEFDLLPLAAMDDDLDPNGFALLSINSAQLNRETSIIVFLRNLSSQYNSTVIATDLRGPFGRTSDDAPAMQIDSDVPDGQMLIRASLPFTLADLGGSDPLDADLTIHDPANDTWMLAAALNQSNSPGYDQPIGDRHVTVAESPTHSPTSKLGDYGVYLESHPRSAGYVWVHHRPTRRAIRNSFRIVLRATACSVWRRSRHRCIRSYRVADGMEHRRPLVGC